MPRSPTRQSWKPWLPEELDKLFNLCSRHATISDQGWQYIASYFSGRTVVACKQQFGRVKAMRAGKPWREHRRDRRKVNPKYVMRAPDARDPRQSPLDLPPPNSLTAFICGDPLPGRSALDRKLAGMPA